MANANFIYLNGHLMNTEDIVWAFKESEKTTKVFFRGTNGLMTINCKYEELAQKIKIANPDPLELAERAMNLTMDVMNDRLGDAFDDRI